MSRVRLFWIHPEDSYSKDFMLVDQKRAQRLARFKKFCFSIFDMEAG
jgi:hypothetical protein